MASPPNNCPFRLQWDAALQEWGGRERPDNTTGTTGGWLYVLSKLSASCRPGRSCTTRARKVYREERWLKRRVLDLVRFWLAPRRSSRSLGCSLRASTLAGISFLRIFDVAAHCSFADETLAQQHTHVGRGNWHIFLGSGIRPEGDAKLRWELGSLGLKHV